MRKSTKILWYGLFISILYIVLCVNLYKDESSNVEKPDLKEDRLEVIDAIIDKEIVDKNDSIVKIAKIDKKSNQNASLDYRIENSVITIAGNMPILDDDDALKQSMMRFCGENYCDRTIIFSADRENPSWKNLAKKVIDLFYEENLSSASFSVDEDNKIKISGEFLTKVSKDRLSGILKTADIKDINNSTHLKVLQSREKIPKIDKNSIIDNNESSTVTTAQNEISELLKSKKIHFYRNRARITKKGRATLNEILTILKDIPNVKIEVRGYTDASGKRNINRWISKERAKSVKNYLGSHGINPVDIEAKGFGEDDLLYEDKPYSKLNRRVEIEIKRR